MKNLFIAMVVLLAQAANADHFQSQKDAAYDASHLQERSRRFAEMLQKVHPREHITADARMLIGMSQDLARVISRGDWEDAIERYEEISEHIHHMQEVVDSDGHLKNDLHVKMGFFSIKFARLELEYTLGYKHHGHGHEHGEEGEGHDHDHDH